MIVQKSVQWYFSVFLQMCLTPTSEIAPIHLINPGYGTNKCPTPHLVLLYVHMNKMVYSYFWSSVKDCTPQKYCDYVFFCVLQRFNPL